MTHRHDTLEDEQPEEASDPGTSLEEETGYVMSHPARDTVIEKYLDMSVLEMPLIEAFDSIGKTIHGIDAIGALMLTRDHMDA